MMNFNNFDANNNQDNNSKNRKKKQQAKLSTALQQNVLEMFSCLLREPGYTVDELATELNCSRRTIFRYITTVNGFYPVISSYFDSNNYIRLTLSKFSEKSLDLNFASCEKAPLLFVFLKALCRPISVAEIQRCFGITKKTAIKIIENIADATPYGDFSDYSFSEQEDK